MTKLLQAGQGHLLLAARAGVSVYSRYPANCTPESARLAANTCDEYQALPWVQAELIGSTWCNVFTGTICHIERVCLDVFHRPYLFTTAYDHNASTYGDFFGFWGWPRRYLIEHWVRVDHLPIADQLRWYDVAIVFSREELALPQKYLEAARRGEQVFGSVSRLKHLVEHEQRRLDEALTARAAFAARHGLVLSLDDVNVGVGTGQQLNLF